MLFTKIDHVHVPSLNVDESVEFYTSVMGFTLSRRVSMMGRDYAFLTMGDCMIEVISTVDGVIPEGADRPFALTVSNMDDAIAHLRQHGTPIIEVTPAKTFYGTNAKVSDPSGVVIELREWAEGDSPQNCDWQSRREDIVRTA